MGVSLSTVEAEGIGENPFYDVRLGACPTKNRPTRHDLKSEDSTSTEWTKCPEISSRFLFTLKPFGAYSALDVVELLYGIDARSSNT